MKNVFTKILLLILVVAVVLLTLSTCSTKKAEPEPEPELDVVEPITPEPEPEPEPVKPTNPLTGEETEEDISGKRPVAIMVNNIENAQPQVGVSQADLLYEILVEGGITRSLAVFQDISKVDMVGSIRSSRHYYVGLALGLDAIYVHAGGSPYAYNLMQEVGIDHIDGVRDSAETFHRDSDRRSNLGYEHSLMFDPPLLPEYLEKNDISTTHKEGYKCGLQFTDAPVTSSGQTADNIDVNFSNYKSTYFDFDQQDGLYHARQFGSDYIDGGNDQQVKVKNVIVLFADMFNIAGDEKGRLDADFTGTGEGYFACGGKYVPIKWERPDDQSEFKLTTEDGKDLQLGVGQSYICIVKTGNEVSFS